ncbi:hypothetical protein SLEP1_g9731 [Rubroshorea leprosula]|uniref:DUF4218 domain-containing protein n=1 Tax=Rubroshorea leprosula TaxID=152421 RepID=A0AAV5I5U8_9ROSI|nr:hypothetical protein SLEP1_g9731 [Rubroshorea leprosula]
MFMQSLIPIAFHDLLPKQVWKPLVEISELFRALCAPVIQVNDMAIWQERIVEIICKLERIFPPSFFDIMEHLAIHLPYEARVGGPVQFRWMYPFERRMHCLKLTMKNKARPEASICESYTMSEITNFISHYFDDGVHSIVDNPPRSIVVGFGDNSGLSIFKYVGKRIGSKIGRRCLTVEEQKAASYYVLMNCEELRRIAKNCENGSEIIQIEYYGSIHQQTIVLFKCDWYEIPPAQGARQVYYTPCPSINHERRGWIAALKTKARSIIEALENKDDQKEGLIPYFQDDEPPIPQQINIDDIAYEPVQYFDGRFIEIHEEVDAGEGIGEEDEEREWEDFETSEEENIETYVEENDSSDDSRCTEAVESTQPLQQPNPFDPQRRGQKEVPTDVVMETPASNVDIQAKSPNDEDTLVATPQQRQGRGQAKPVQMPTNGTKIPLELDEYRVCHNMSDDRLWSSCGRISQMLTHRGYSITEKMKFKHVLSELKAKCARRNFLVKPPDMNPELWARLVYLWTEDESHLRRSSSAKANRAKGPRVTHTSDSMDVNVYRKKMKMQQANPEGHLLTFPEVYTNRRQHKGKGEDQLPIYYNDEAQEMGARGRRIDPTIAHGELLLRATGGVKKGWLKGLDIHTHPQDIGMRTSRWEPFRPPIIRQSNRVIELEQIVESLKADNNSLRQSQMNLMADNESLRQQQMTLATQMQQLYQHLGMTPVVTSGTVTQDTPKYLVKVLQRFYPASSSNNFMEGIDGLGVLGDCSVDVHAIGFRKNGFGTREDDNFKQGIDGSGVPRDYSVDVHVIGFLKNGFEAREDGDVLK